MEACTAKLAEQELELAPTFCICTGAIQPTDKCKCAGCEPNGDQWTAADAAEGADASMHVKQVQGCIRLVVVK